MSGSAKATGVAVAVVGAIVAGMLSLILVVGGQSQVNTAAGSTGWGSGLSDAVPAAYRPWVLKAGSICLAFPSAIIAAQIEAESGWRQDALSSAGAQGPSQFMPGTWAIWGRDDDGNGRALPTDIADAVMAQGRYDCALANQVAALTRPALGPMLAPSSGPTPGTDAGAAGASSTATGGAPGSTMATLLALAAYNAGPAAVLKAHGIPAIPETLSYVARIQSLAARYATITAPLGDGLSAGASGFAAAEIAAARTQLGVPYAWGGGSLVGPSGEGFDCSGLVRYAVYQGSGGTVVLPRTADQQIKAVRAVPLNQLQPGDLIAMTVVGQSTAHHIVIYLGNGQVIQAPETGSKVKISPLTNWTGQILQAGRVK